MGHSPRENCGELAAHLKKIRKNYSNMNKDTEVHIFSKKAIKQKCLR